MEHIRTSWDMTQFLSSNISHKLHELLKLRWTQLSEHLDGDLGELAHFIIVAPGDTLGQVEIAAGFPLLPTPPWEWVLNHDGLFEAPIIVSDSGFGVVLIVPDGEGMDGNLINLLRSDASD